MEDHSVTVASEKSGEVSKVVVENIELLLKQHREERKKESRSRMMVTRVTRFMGSVTSIYIHILFFVLWIIASMGWIQLPRLDPSLHHLAVFASLESILLATCIMITQNRMQEIADQRSDLHLHISLLAERETTRLIRLVARLAQQAGIEADEVDDDLADLMRDESPEKVMEEIKRSQGTKSQE
jgi:uncharacterized membrane protein